MYLIRILFLLSVVNLAFAGPWFTGPLLAPAGRTIPAGHVNIEPYGFYTGYPKGYRNLEGVPVISFGITSFLDVQTSIPYDYSWVDRQHGNGIGDYSLGLGMQVLRQQDDSWLPDLRFVVQEVFPTGRYEHLDPKKQGTEQTGLGAFQTLFGFNFQKLMTLKNEHYLRTRLSLVGVKFSDSTIHGPNAFGGGLQALGKVKLKNAYSADFAVEYTLNQHWVPVFEVLYSHSPASNFQGNPGFTPGGTSAAGIGGNANEQVSFAPALEYNFTSNLGVIGGAWFSVTGPNAAKFVSAVFAINCFI